jgi:hypothetical protein
MEPLADALAQATAVLHLINQLLEDDPSDEDVRVVPALRRAQEHAQNLVLELKEITK